MNATWRRVVIGGGIAVILLGVEALEVAERYRLLTQGDLLNLEYGPPAEEEAGAPAPRLGLTSAIQVDRMTVLEIDRTGRQIVGVNGDGQRRADQLATEAAVVTGGGRTSDLALVNPGDLIRAERRGGRIQKVVVLRQAWQELTSPEQ